MSESSTEFNAIFHLGLINKDQEKTSDPCLFLELLNRDAPLQIPKSGRKGKPELRMPLELRWIVRDIESE